MVFFYRERGEPEQFGTVLLINNKKHLISQTKLHGFDRGDFARGAPRLSPKGSTNIESLPYKMLFR